MDPAPPSLPDLNADPPAEDDDHHIVDLHGETPYFPEPNAAAADLDGGELDDLEEDHSLFMFLDPSVVRCRKRLRASEEDDEARGAPRRCYDDDVAEEHAFAYEEILMATQEYAGEEDVDANSAAAAEEEGGTGRPVLLELFPRHFSGEANADQSYTHDDTPVAQEISGEQIAADDTYYDNNYDYCYLMAGGGAYDEEHHLPGGQQADMAPAAARDYFDGDKLSAENQRAWDLLFCVADGTRLQEEQEAAMAMAAAQGSVEHVSDQEQHMFQLLPDDPHLQEAAAAAMAVQDSGEYVPPEEDSYEAAVLAGDMDEVQLQQQEQVVMTDGTEETF